MGATPLMKKTVDFKGFYGTPGGIRTPDLLIRSQTLYPAELLAHLSKVFGDDPAEDFIPPPDFIMISESALYFNSYCSIITDMHKISTCYLIADIRQQILPYKPILSGAVISRSPFYFFFFPVSIVTPLRLSSLTETKPLTGL